MGANPSDPIRADSDKVMRSLMGRDYMEVAWAERKVDIYAGPDCDQHEPLWDMYWQGDKDGDAGTDPIVLDAKTLPPGTKVVISFPVCPKCDCDIETCKQMDCDFDWHQWVENKYC